MNNLQTLLQWVVDSVTPGLSPADNLYREIVDMPSPEEWKNQVSFLLYFLLKVSKSLLQPNLLPEETRKEEPLHQIHDSK